MRKGKVKDEQAPQSPYISQITRIALHIEDQLQAPLRKGSCRQQRPRNCSSQPLNAPPRKRAVIARKTHKAPSFSKAKRSRSPPFAPNITPRAPHHLFLRSHPSLVPFTHSSHALLALRAPRRLRNFKTVQSTCSHRTRDTTFLLLNFHFLPFFLTHYDKFITLYSVN